jgi:hypothetical protein
MYCFAVIAVSYATEPLVPTQVIEHRTWDDLVS